MKQTELFFNRELSWLEFNARVLEEALKETTPLLERLKFLAIFANNLDEFFMVRVSSVLSQLQSGMEISDFSSYPPQKLLILLSQRILQLVKQQYNCYTKQILPQLTKHNIHLWTAADIPKKHKDGLEELFEERTGMILTPMAVDSSHPFPFIPGKTMHLLIKLTARENQPPLMAIIPVPQQNRFIRIHSFKEEHHYIFMEEYLKLFVHKLFEGYEIEKICAFRVTRDAELAIDEEEVRDLLNAIEAELKKRARGNPIRLELDTSDPEIIDFLRIHLEIDHDFIYSLSRPLNFASFFELISLPFPNEFYEKPFPPIIPIEFNDKERSIFEIIDEQDRLVNLPYESFAPVIRLIESAAIDPQVLAIKQTLYRTSADSPLISALKLAAENGKQVTVVVELKARFDEAQNITWARQLEQSGCHVVYGLAGLKTHAKAALIVREEPDGIKRYVHLSTGNYNDKTARIYTDIGLFTTDAQIATDTSALFNFLTGYSSPPRWRKLITAPLDLRNFFLDKIEKEKEYALEGRRAHIVAKMNALVDPQLIKALYDASRAGVTIELYVRGICCLRPGVPQLSENIKVLSIVDRFLEHSRIFYFYDNGQEHIYLSSSDWMIRNFDRRVELLFPVEEPILKKEIIDQLNLLQQSTVKCRQLMPNGRYLPKKSIKKAQAIRFQTSLYQKEKKQNQPAKRTSVKVFKPREQE